jgi:hypothetical protein
VAVEHHVLASHAAASGQHITQTGAAPEIGGEAETAEHTGDAHAESGREAVLGIVVEDPGVVTASALAWLVLIVALLRFGRWLLPVVVLAAGAAFALDVGEIIRQVGETQSGLALLAALVAAGHGAVVVLALLALFPPRRSAAS